MRVKKAIAIDTAMIECGSEKTNHEFCIVAMLATSPMLATRDCTMPLIWPMMTMPNSHMAALPVAPRPTPRQAKSSRNRMPVRLKKSTSTSACASTPAVVTAPSRLTRSQSQTARSRLTASPWNSRKKTPRPAIETMLLTTGAHV